MNKEDHSLQVAGPINAKALGVARGRIGTPLRVLVLKAWPEQHDALMAIPGFHAVDEYNGDEMDSMQREEIGRVLGIHVVIQYHTKPTYAPSGKIRSVMTGGKKDFTIESDAA